jgi:hypothetical protein
MFCSSYLLRGRVKAIALIVSLGLGAGPAMARNDGVEEYLAKYRCGVLLRLEVVHSIEPRGMDRFIILGLKHHPHGYVQCLMIDNDTRVLCEASSGFWLPPEGAPPISVVPPAGVSALAALGFSTDISEGNFQKMLSIRDGDFGEVADLMLLALYHGYGVRSPRASVRIDTPLIGEEEGRLALCEPLVS